MPQIVINTRPVERAAPLTHRLQAAGLTVIEMPMLTLQSRPTTDSDKMMMRQWLAGEYQMVVIVSPTAAASGLAAWQALARAHKMLDGIDNAADIAMFEGLKAPSLLIAVGDATAAVLNRAKLDTTVHQVHQPKVANNEGMLEMPEVERLQAGDKVLIWRGLGGRRLLVDALQARGVHIDSIAWYERTMPADATFQYQKWQQGFLTQKVAQDITLSERAKPIVVVSSGTAFEHWTHVVNEVAVNFSTQKSAISELSNLTTGMVEPKKALTLSDFTYVVLGERLTNWMADQQLSHWRVDDLAPDTILTAISAHL